MNRFAQWLYGLPAVCVGIALALVWGRVPAMLLILGGFIGAALLSGAFMGLMQIALAGGALILCILCPLPASRSAQLAGALSLGVYLAHPLVFSVLSRTTPIPEGSLAIAVLGCIGGLAIALGTQWAAQVPWRPRALARHGNAQNTIS